jgi:glycosyltransferase involved in cell wall biosynthesis
MQKYLSDPRIKYFQKPNSGQPDSLNKGVAKATGEFITFLDSDDEAYPDWLQKVVAKIDENTGIVSAEANRKFANGKMIRETFNTVKFMGEKVRIKFTCGSMFIRKSIFEGVGGYDIELKSSIQTDLCYRLLLHLKDTRYKIVSVPVPLVQINVHDGPRIRTNWTKLSAGGIQFLDKHFELFKKYDPEVISNLCGSIAYYNYRLHKRNNAINYMLKAIKYNPLKLVNYPRIVKYACL